MPLVDEVPTRPDPAPARGRWRLAALLIGAVVVVIAGGWLLFGDDPDAETATGGALDAAPSLADLAASGEDTPQAEDAAPDFSVRTIGGGAFTLSDHLADDGRPVILNLWASWCFPCRAEMPAIDAFAAAHPEVLVVGVSVQDDPVAAEEFVEEIGVAYTIGHDEKNEVNDTYRPLGLPATFLISGDGIIVKRLFGGITEESLQADFEAFLSG